ncbi:MAG: transglutaminase domain-containing protein [Planctomycetota bacterium]
MNSSLYATMKSSLLVFALSAILCTAGQRLSAQVAPLDSDGDGLTDFHETHKYFTDPENADSDADGVPDGDWLERREFQYTIRSVVHVMKPVTIDYINDDYQDARVLDESDDHMELEVIHYPFNTVAESIISDDDWRTSSLSQQYWLEPGRSSDCSTELKRNILDALAEDSIQLEGMSDVEVVKTVSDWLCDRAENHNAFTGFVTAWDDEGKRYLPPMFAANVRRNLEDRGLTLEEQWDRDVSASGMFEHRTRGTCTSSSIYLCGCLRAIGIPTRIVLCIPVVDAGDEREMDLVRRISDPGVRQHLLRALTPMRDSWSSHTFNEVFVGGRWYRLNYNQLGQGIYDRQLFGLVTHTATFHDWADAEMFRTVGKRQKGDGTDVQTDIFGFNNPYSTIALRDDYGEHCTLEMPPVEEDRVVVEEIFWTDDETLPLDISDNCRRRGRFGFIARVSGVGGLNEFLAYMEQTDLVVQIAPSGERPPFFVKFDPGCFWVSNGEAYIYLPVEAVDRNAIQMNVEYVFQPRNESDNEQWSIRDELKTLRNNPVPGT